MRLVDRIGPEAADQVDGIQLRAAVVFCVEARHRRPALAGRIRVQQGVVIQKVIPGQRSQPGCAIQTNRAFVIAYALRIARRRERGCPLIGLRDVVKQVLRRRREGAGRKSGPRQNTGGRRAARRVVGLTLLHGSAQPGAEQLRKVAAAHLAGERSCLVREVAGAVGRRRYGDQAGVHALRLPGALVVSEKEEPARVGNRTADRAAELVLVERRAREREVVSRIESGIAKVLVHAAVQPCTPGACLDRNLSPALVAELGVKAARQDFQARDGVERRHDRHPHVHVLLHVGTVDSKGVRRFSLAAYRKGTDIQVPRGWGACNTAHHDRIWLRGARRRNAWAQSEQVGKASPVQRKLRQLLLA